MNQLGVTRFNLKTKNYIDIKYSEGVKNLSIRYLNEINSSKSVAHDGYVKCLLTGPDIICNFPFTSLQKRYMKGAKKSVSSTSQQIRPIHPCAKKWKRETDLQYHLSSQKKTQWTTCKAGCQVIRVQGPKNCLSALTGRKQFLIPFINEVSSKTVTYALVGRENIDKVLRKNRSVDKFNQAIRKYSNGANVTTLCYDAKEVSNGLIIEFVEDETLTHLRTTQYTTSSAMQHCEFEGVILSHWIPIPAESRIPIEERHLDVIGHTYGPSGNTTRSCTFNLGTNLYVGLKNSSRPLVSPRMPKEDVMFSQIDRQSYNKTYIPVVYKMLNVLTNQAGSVMSMTDHTIER